MSAQPVRSTDPRWRRLAWFVGLWAAGVAVFALISLGARALLGV